MIIVEFVSAVIESSADGQSRERHPVGDSRDATSSIRRTTRNFLNSIGFDVRRIGRTPLEALRFSRIYDRYKNQTMCSRQSYMTNLALVSTVKVPGCVIECGVWKGGTSAGMAEVLGNDRQYFLFDSFQGHVDPKPVDGPAALAWAADTSGPHYYDKGRVGPEEADSSMRRSGAVHYKLIKGWFEDTLRDFHPPGPIAVLRIDCDWYEGTLTCLRALFPHLADGGIYIADGYPEWDGYARAVHQYLAEYKETARLSHLNGLYFVTKGASPWNE